MFTTTQLSRYTAGNLLNLDEHLSYDDCLTAKREDSQIYSMLRCVWKLCTMIRTQAWAAVLKFVCLLGLNFVFCVCLLLVYDFVLVETALFLCGLIRFSFFWVPSEEIGWEDGLRNDLLCRPIEWDVKTLARSVDRSIHQVDRSARHIQDAMHAAAFVEIAAENRLYSGQSRSLRELLWWKPDVHTLNNMRHSSLRLVQGSSDLSCYSNESTETAFQCSGTIILGKNPYQQLSLQDISYKQRPPLRLVMSNKCLGSRVVRVLDSGAVRPGFKPQPRRCRVTVLGKLFTSTVPLFTKQRNW